MMFFFENKRNLLLRGALIVFCLCVPVLCFPGTYYELTLNTGMKGILFKPRGFSKWKSYPLIIALHGKGQTAALTMKKWETIAEKQHVLLFCPQGSDPQEGYLRGALDDRVQIKELVTYLYESYRIRRKETLLIGFSRGGNLAIELGTLYPDEFPTIVSLFGFFNRGVPHYISKQPNYAFKKSRFLFVTGELDPSFQSSQKGYSLLKNKNIRSEVYAYKQKKHSYPKNLNYFYRQLREWMHSNKHFSL